MKLIRIQCFCYKRAVRVMAFEHFPSNPIFRDLKILKLDDLFGAQKNFFLPGSKLSTFVSSCVLSSFFSIPHKYIPFPFSP